MEELTEDGGGEREEEEEEEEHTITVTQQPSCEDVVAIHPRHE